MRASRGFVPVLHGATDSRPDEIDTLLAAQGVAETLQARGFATEIIGLGLDLTPVEALAPKRPLCVFNLVDALAGEARLAPMVPVLLERLALPFTGCPAGAWFETLSKTAAKRTLASAGLPTPDWSEDGGGLAPGARIIVKPVYEHGSLGLDQTSIALGKDAPQLIAARTARYGTAHFAEGYIRGREFNLSLLEREGKACVLPIAEILFEGFGDADHIVGYDAKWLPDTAAYQGTPRRFGLESCEPALAAQLQRLALRCWTLFGLQGYGRVDFRVDETGAPFVLEVNVNPCLSEDAGFAAAALRSGISYAGLIEEIAAAAAGLPMEHGALKASA